MIKDWWTGKASLTSALLLLILGGWLFWTISGLAIVDFIHSPNWQIMFYVVLGLRLLFLAFASVAVWRCAGHVEVPGKILARVAVVMVAVMFLGFTAAVLLPALARA